MTNESKTEGLTIELERIKEMIPHRDPFLLIDRVTNIQPGEEAIGIKHVRPDEYYFKGHFPEKPIMPGVLIVEAMAQTSAVLVVHTLGASAEGKLVYFMTVDEARFRKIVVPGDTLNIHVKKERNRGNVWKFKCEAMVNGQRVADAIISAMIVD